MIKQIRELLNKGEDVYLECTNKDEFLNINDGRSFIENNDILKSGLKVDWVESVKIYIKNCPYAILFNEFKYFKIKEQEPTFDDLIDVAVQAYKDGFLSGVEIKESSLNATVKSKDSKIISFSTGKMTGTLSFIERINFIKSLYTETFVIESDVDIYKFQNNVESIVLANGVDIIDDVMFRRCIPYFTYDGINCVQVPFSVLKGATVTQKRGDND